MTKYHFNDDANIQLWIDQEGNGDVDMLERQLDRGLIRSPRKEWAREYVGRMRRAKMSEADAAAHALNERAVIAQEQAASAARSSQKAAWSSAWSGAIAVGVSLAALAISVITWKVG